MKKSLLFACALVIVGQVAAQTKVYDLDVIANEKKVTIGEVEMNQPMTFEAFNAESAAKYRAAAEEFAGSDYYYCDGMMHAGLNADFYGYYPMIIIPYLDSVIWKNAVGPTTWSEYSRSGWTVYEENSESYVSGYGFGIYYLPKTSEHTYTLKTAAGNDTVVNIKGYIYGESEARQFLASGYHSNEGNIEMTLCGMYTDTLNGGEDFYRVGAGSRGSYSYGTNLLVDSITGKTADTIGVIVRNLGTMKIEQINIPVYNASENDAAILPEGASVNVALYAADLTAGLIDKGTVLAKTTVTVDDYASVGSGMGTIVVKFYEKNILGDLVETPIVIDGDFYLELTNFNESKCDFGIYSDYYTPGGTTLYTLNGKYTTLWSSGGSNLAISFDAYYPAIVCDTTVNVMVVPVEGGLAYYEGDEENNAALFFTNNNPEDWEIDVPEWLEYDIDTTYYSSNDAVYVLFNAQELPEGEEGRYAEVVINADGATYTLYIKQGDIEITGTEDVVVDKKQFFNNKRYNLLGVEVDEDYNGIVIMNGKKFIQ